MLVADGPPIIPRRDDSSVFHKNFRWDVCWRLNCLPNAGMPCNKINFAIPVT